MGWKIIYFKTETGKFPVYVFIESLTSLAQAKVIHSLDLLEEFGILLGLPHVKKISGTDLWELRVLGKDNIRIFYIAMTGKSFLLLHGFVKKKQKADIKEIKTAEKRLQEYRNRNTN